MYMYYILIHMMKYYKCLSADQSFPFINTAGVRNTATIDSFSAIDIHNQWRGDPTSDNRVITKQ